MWSKRVVKVRATEGTKAEGVQHLEAEKEPHSRLRPSEPQSEPGASLELTKGLKEPSRL